MRSQLSKSGISAISANSLATVQPRPTSAAAAGPARCRPPTPAGRGEPTGNAPAASHRTVSPPRFQHVGAATAAPSTLASTGVAGNSDSSQSVEVPFTRLVTPFALTGLEQIHQAIGEVASFSSTATAQEVGGTVGAAAVPEPSSLLLLGTGLLALTRLRKKKRQQL